MIGPQRRRDRVRRTQTAQAMVEFALLSGVFFLLLVGIFDFGRAVAAYISIAELAHEGARQMVLRSNANSHPPDSLVVNYTLSTIGGGGLVLTEDPCLQNPTPCTTPSTPTTPNTGYIWLTPPPSPTQPRNSGNAEITVRVTYLYAPFTALIAQTTGASLLLTASSSMRAEY